MLRETGKDTSIYVTSFLSVDIPSPESLKEMQPGDERRARRKILMYWAVLHRAGYAGDLGKLKHVVKFDPGLNETARKAMYGANSLGQCPSIDTLDALATEFEKAAEADRKSKLKSSSGKDLFDADDLAVLGFLKPVLQRERRTQASFRVSENTTIQRPEILLRKFYSCSTKETP